LFVDYNIVHDDEAEIIVEWDRVFLPNGPVKTPGCFIVEVTRQGQTMYNISLDDTRAVFYALNVQDRINVRVTLRTEIGQVSTNTTKELAYNYVRSDSIPQLAIILIAVFVVLGLLVVILIVVLIRRRRAAHSYHFKPTGYGSNTVYKPSLHEKSGKTTSVTHETTHGSMVHHNRSVGDKGVESLTFRAGRLEARETVIVHGNAVINLDSTMGGTPSEDVQRNAVFSPLSPDRLTSQEEKILCQEKLAKMSQDNLKAQEKMFGESQLVLNTASESLKHNEEMRQALARERGVTVVSGQGTSQTYL